MTGGVQTFRLRWDGFRSRLSSVFDELRRDEELLDMTLCCDGGVAIKAHRILLSASSPSIRLLLKNHPCQHPVFFLKDTSAEDLRAIIQFVYSGEVNVTQTQLASFIKTAEMLQIKGLSGEEGSGDVQQTPPGPDKQSSSVTDPTPPPPPPPDWSEKTTAAAGPPPNKRRRRSGEPAADSAPATAAAPAAASSSTAGVNLAGIPVVFKTEQVDLSDDDGGDPEDPLSRLSSLEDRRAGPSAQITLDSTDVRPLAGHGDTADGQSAGSAGGTAASGGGSTTERQSSRMQSPEFIQPGQQDDDLFAVLDAEGLPEILPTRRSRLRDYRLLKSLEPSDLAALCLQEREVPILPPMTMEQILQPQLEMRILSARILRKLVKQLPLSETDWRELMQSLHERWQPYDYHVQTARNWYPKMAESIIEQFPFVLPQLTREQALNAVTSRLRNKFRNSRRPRDKKKEHLDHPGSPGTPASCVLPGPSGVRQKRSGSTSEGRLRDNADMGQHGARSITVEQDDTMSTSTEQTSDEAAEAGQSSASKAEEQHCHGNARSEQRCDANHAAEHSEDADAVLEPDF